MLGDIYYLSDKVTIVMMVKGGQVRPWVSAGKWGECKNILDSDLGMSFNPGSQRAYLVMTWAEAQLRLEVLAGMGPFDLANDKERDLATEMAVLTDLWGTTVNGWPARALWSMKSADGSSQTLYEYCLPSGLHRLKFHTVGWSYAFQARPAQYWHLTDLWLETLYQNDIRWAGGAGVPSVSDMYRARQAVGHKALNVKGKVLAWLAENPK